MVRQRRIDAKEKKEVERDAEKRKEKMGRRSLLPTPIIEGKHAILTPKVSRPETKGQ